MIGPLAIATTVLAALSEGTGAVPDPVTWQHPHPRWFAPPLAALLEIDVGEVGFELGDWEWPASAKEWVGCQDEALRWLYWTLEQTKRPVDFYLHGTARDDRMHVLLKARSGDSNRPFPRATVQACYLPKRRGEYLQEFMSPREPGYERALSALRGFIGYNETVSCHQTYVADGWLKSSNVAALSVAKHHPRFEKAPNVGERVRLVMYWLQEQICTVEHMAEAAERGIKDEAVAWTHHYRDLVQRGVPKEQWE